MAIELPTDGAVLLYGRPVTFYGSAPSGAKVDCRGSVDITTNVATWGSWYVDVTLPEGPATVECAADGRWESAARVSVTSVRRTMAASTPTASPVAATAAPAPTAAPDAATEFPAGFVSARQAADHVDQVATVCGKVVSATYAEASSGSPTFLNLDKPYPDDVFTIVIWAEDRASFGGAPEKMFAGARVCITGLIGTYNGTAQIESSGGDIKVHE